MPANDSESDLLPALAPQVRDDLPGQGGAEAGHGTELLGLQGGDALDGTEAHQQLGRTRLSDAGHVLQGRPAQPSGPRVAMRRDGVAMDLVPQALEKLQDGVVEPQTQGIVRPSGQEAQ